MSKLQLLKPALQLWTQPNWLHPGTVVMLPLQTFPQLLQLLMSEPVSTHELPHRVYPVSQAQAEGAPLQAKFYSIEQLAEHPSPAVLLPSSHASAPATMPSPQVVAQPEPAGQLQPVSTPQLLEQPSPSVVLPSSHPSVPTLMPSPQVVEHRDLPETCT